MEVSECEEGVVCPPDLCKVVEEGGDPLDEVFLEFLVRDFADAVINLRGSVGGSLNEVPVINIGGLHQLHHLDSVLEDVSFDEVTRPCQISHLLRLLGESTEVELKFKK